MASIVCSSCSEEVLLSYIASRSWKRKKNGVLRLVWECPHCSVIESTPFEEVKKLVDEVKLNES